MKPKSFPFITLCLCIAVAAIYYFQSHLSKTAGDANSTPTTNRPPVSSGDESRLANAEISRTKSAERPANASRTGKLDDDFNPSDYQRATMGDGTSDPSGAAIAYVQIPSTNRRTALVPNSLGEYEAQPTLTEETVGIRLRIEDVQPGTPVSVVILDGGSFPDGSGPSKIIKVGTDSQIAFKFTTSANTGYHRVRVQPSGSTPRILDFTASRS